jgi:hypothetical protein
MLNVTTSGTDRNDNAKNQATRRPDPDGKFSTTVNGASLKFSDATPNGEHILDGAGLKPAADYVLIQLMGHSSRSIALDEKVDHRERKPSAPSRATGSFGSRSMDTASIGGQARSRSSSCAQSATSPTTKFSFWRGTEKTWS